MTGQTISHYRILEKLGEGGMGVVYKAEDTKLKRKVALKFVAPPASGSEEDKARLVHEARAAATLDHPNICTVHEIDQTDGQTFISMAYVDGKSLKEKNEAGPLKLNETLDIAIQVAQGLQEAHQKDIVHRDVKSANIMVTTKGLAKIMDFGLAKLTEQTKSSKPGVTTGTLPYMSPEQLQKERVDRRTDIWSLGVVIYEMLTGRLPFKGKYDQAVAYLIVNQEPEPITGLRSGVPLELERIVNKALAKNPQERYQHVDELLVDLRSVSRELEADKPKTAPTPTRLPRRHRVLLYGGIALLLLLLALFGRDLFTGGDESIDSIAVLPLKNYSGDADQEYLADSMTEELIDKLGPIEALRVISSTSAMHYKATDKSLQEIARELDVAAIVEGSMQLFGEQVRIRVRLIDAKADEQLWNGSFERELRNVLALQRQVALAIARQVEVTLTPQEESRLAEAPEVNPDAYRRYALGLQARSKYQWERALEYFEQAIAIDSSFTPAYAALAIEYAMQGGLDFIPGLEVKARQLAQKALSLDPSLSQAYIAIGILREVVDWDWAGAEEAFRRAIELNPGDAFAHHELGMLWSRLGRLEDALAREKQALYLDPLSVRYQRGVAEIYFFGGRYDEAIVEAKKTRELDPSWGTGVLGGAYSLKGQYEEAISTWGWTPGEENLWFLAVSGRREEALKKIEDEKAVWAKGNANPAILISIAQAYATLGENAQALDWLEKAYEARAGFLIYVKVRPLLYPLHREPRFQALLEKMGLAE